MRMREFKIMKAVLSEEIGWSWPLFLIKCLVRKRAVFNNTHWASEKDSESDLAKRISISVSIYLNLSDKVEAEKAFEIIRRILIPIGTNEQLENLKSWNISHYLF